MATGLPDNCATVLECCVCKGQDFRVSWNWKPRSFGFASGGAWMLDCQNCGRLSLLHRDGLPNPQEIHGAKFDLPITRTSRLRWAAFRVRHRIMSAIELPPSPEPLKKAARRRAGSGQPSGRLTAACSHFSGSSS
jgi:hypothetical protein